MGTGAITVTYNGFSYMDTPFALMSDNYNPEHLQRMMCPNLPKCPKGLCECVHVIKVPIGKVVQMTYIDGIYILHKRRLDSLITRDIDPNAKS